MAIAMDEAGMDALGFGEHVHAQAALLHLADQRGELQFGDARPDAAVDAVTEGEVAPRILAVDDDAVAIGEDALVAVRRGVPERNFVARLI